MDDKKDFLFGVDDTTPVENAPAVKPSQTVSAPTFSSELFNSSGKEVSKSPDETDKAKELVESVLHVGIVHKVNTDEAVKNQILQTADKVIKTNLSVVDSKAEKADKEAYFDANKDACSYFGFDEKTTSKTHVMMMKFWAWVFNALYILSVGFFVVAPIVFFCSKIRVAVKKNWIVVILALLIYAIAVLTPFIITWLGRV